MRAFPGYGAMANLRLDRDAARARVREMDRVLGLGVDELRRPEIAPDLVARIREREQARASRQWAAADAIRDELAARGRQLMDTPEGTDWYQTA